ncbi:MAG: sigma-54-dependent Fis family transcriptional regulator [Candidatus Dadabacteria bacterium]|nr:MAG: sigma-54-dependent Fis family transcriptional regulator [Candidatus Dadabacteria bacterium]
MSERTILVIDDEESIRMTLDEAFRAAGHRVLAAATARQARRILRREGVDAVVQDLMLPDCAGLDLLDWIRSAAPEVPVILITAYGTVRTAVNAVKRGAYDFVEKPFDVEHLTLVVDRALEARCLTERVGQFERTLAASFDPDGVVCQSPAMKQVMDQARRVAASPTATVLITGETGVGKEVVGRAIHFLGPRRKHPLFEVNCAALPAHLLESEFFGHVKGAFTGADTGRKGILEEANGSTLLLDEIGEMPLDLQAKLLRFLEDRTVRRIGETRGRRVDVRIVAMTNRDLEKEAAAGRFRRDLYYRLHVVPIHVPPLRERPEDVAPLFRLFLRATAVSLGRSTPEVSPEVEDRLQAHSWPGNVRELRNLTERILLLEDVGDRVEARHLPPELSDSVPPARRTDTARIPRFAEAHDALSRELIQRALREAPSLAAAARLLGIDRATFRYHARRLGISYRGGGENSPRGENVPG